MLGMRLMVLHNLYFYNTMMKEIRQAIRDNRYKEYKKEKLEVLIVKRINLLWEETQMNQMSQFILLAGEGAPANPLYVIVLQLVLIGALMYFIIFRPQKKQQKQMDAMLSGRKG